MWVWTEGSLPTRKCGSGQDFPRPAYCPAAGNGEGMLTFYRSSRIKPQGQPSIFSLSSLDPSSQEAAKLPLLFIKGKSTSLKWNIQARNTLKSHFGKLSRTVSQAKPKKGTGLHAKLDHLLGESVLERRLGFYAERREGVGGLGWRAEAWHLSRVSSSARDRPLGRHLNKGVTSHLADFQPSWYPRQKCWPGETV